MANNHIKHQHPTVIKLASKLGISREEVARAVNNLLYGDGAVYRRMIANPLHGVRA